MTNQAESTSSRDIERFIHALRNRRVILDADLASIYGVQTRALNQAVKRNQERFPADFMFDLTREEILGISQTVISLGKLKFSKQVRAFTEHGALMAATVLNSPRAVAMSLYIIRAFVKIREDFAANATILKRLAEIEKLCCSTTARCTTFIKSSGPCSNRLQCRPNPKSVFTSRKMPSLIASNERPLAPEAYRGAPSTWGFRGFIPHAVF